MIDVFDIFVNCCACYPANNRHDELKQAKMKPQAKACPSAGVSGANRHANRKSIAAKGEGNSETENEIIQVHGVKT